MSEINKKPKHLNMSYNSCYNSNINYIQLEKLISKLDRRKAEITFNPHLFDRKEYWNLDLDKIEETIKTGKILLDKCELPNKICFSNYFGKENITYVVIVKYHKNFIEVVTTWPKKGK